MKRCVTGAVAKIKCLNHFHMESCNDSRFNPEFELFNDGMVTLRVKGFLNKIDLIVLSDKQECRCPSAICGTRYKDG